ncbi:UNVERIFIED_CONTAM: hypothetical protein Sradi_3835800 [Sesamum radiatum]|uniref:Reverse transcriptase Ty1/copia-type domain-containing protein n=1 Tax=Sesamum radiatum TaxID=300843 RepID=A0AAW2Q178_SESRA
MKFKMDSMSSNHVWTLVNRPKGVKLVRCKWVYKRKIGADGEVTTFKGSVRFPSRIGRDMLENHRNNHLLSRETVSPRLIEDRLDLDHPWSRRDALDLDYPRSRRDASTSTRGVEAGCLDLDQEVVEALDQRGSRRDASTSTRRWSRRDASARRWSTHPSGQIKELHSPHPGVAPVAPLFLSLFFALGENIDFHDEVIEAIRNLPPSHSDFLEILMGSD